MTSIFVPEHTRETITQTVEDTKNAGAISANVLTGFDLTAQAQFAIAWMSKVEQIIIVNGSGANLVATSNGKTLPRIAPGGKGELTGVRLTELFLTPDAAVNDKEVTIITKGPPLAWAGPRLG